MKDNMKTFFASAPGTSKGTLRICRGKVAGHESYRVECGVRDVTLTAEDDDGVRRGVCWIEDQISAGDLKSCTRKPWLKHRISRCYFSPIGQAVSAESRRNPPGAVRPSCCEMMKEVS